jgi:hypothetical protein
MTSMIRWFNSLFSTQADPDYSKLGKNKKNDDWNPEQIELFCRKSHSCGNLSSMQDRKIKEIVGEIFEMLRRIDLTNLSDERALLDNSSLREFRLFHAAAGSLK